MFYLRLSLAFLFILHFAQAQSPLQPDSARVFERVKILASPEFGGRAPATDGGRKATTYIEQEFKTLGLKPGANGAFTQPFTLTTGVELGAKNSVTFSIYVERPGIPMEQIRPVKVGWKIGADYQPYGFTESGSAQGKVVFVGYGISTDSYDDYKGMDVKGAIVIVIRGLPNWAEKDDKLRKLQAIRTKATVARDKGAAAICFVNQEGDSSDVLSRFGIDRLGKNSGIIALQVRRTPCARIFPPKETTLFVAETTINKTKKPMSFVLKNTTVALEASTVYIEGETANVIGMVPGTDASVANEYVVIGGHYDHLGMGDENSLSSSHTPAIHFGADDNASGTAGVIELAQIFAANPARRTMVFMAFSGEEKGLLGSKHWVSNPTQPLANAVAMFNMDMIGRLKDDKLNIQGTGTSESWTSIIDSAKSGLGFVVSTTADGYGPSDHSSFTAKEIPVMFVFTGLHSDYHRPSDTYDKINAGGEARILTFVERAARFVADAPARLTFKQGAEVNTKQQSSSMGLRVTFGVIPDYADDPQGLRISGVRAGSPADKAGLQADDIVTQLGTTQIKNIYDLMAALEKQEPGNTVDCTVIRDDKPVKMKVTFVSKN